MGNTLTNIYNNIYNTFFTYKDIKYIDENSLINKTIISFSFFESPNYILYLKDNNKTYYQYKSSIINYPNYLLKNKKKISKNLFTNIKIKSISWYSIDQYNKYYFIEDYDNNSYKLYSNKLQKIT